MGGGIGSKERCRCERWEILYIACLVSVLASSSSV